ncbi:helix-turn-helix domain-containing protein [Caldalkalibacillus salinus]|uniref:helix-turn-helix domain-containing protein n=1 Tax=Caldalkalibacillus salinus TaxID=2803787 RepID=UPI0019237CF1|nr:helix-turn-helix domain-containing protein [Caldalkalibacillus salinus]
MIKKFNHYYTKIITFAIILGTVPVIIVGLFSYMKSAEVIQFNVAKEKEQSVYQIQTNVEQLLKTVNHSFNYFVTSSFLTETLHQPLTLYQFQQYNQIKKELNHLQTFDTGITDILLVSLESGWLINNNGLTRLTDDQYDTITSNYLSLPTRSAWVLEEKDNVLFNPYVTDACAYYINLVKQLPLRSTTKTGVIVAKIPVCKLTSLMSHPLDSEKIMILDETFQVIAHSDPEFIGRDMSNHELTRLKESGLSEGQFNITLNETDYKVTFRQSDFNQWTYLSVIKISDLNKESSSIGWFTFLICVLLLTLSLTISLVGSRRIYKPVRQLQNMITQTFNQRTDFKQHANHKHHNEFELIESQIQHMLDRHDKLEESLKGQVTQLKQFFMVKLLHGHVSPDEIESKLNSFRFQKEWKRLCVFTLQIDTLDHTAYEDKDRDLLLFAVNTMVEDLIPREQRMTPIVMNHTQVTVIQSQHETEELYTRFINGLAQDIQKKVKQSLDIPVSVGISLPYEQLHATKHAYKEGLEALKYRLKSGTESIIFFENLDRGTTFHTFFPKHIENDIFDAIKVGDKPKVDESLHHLLNTIFAKDGNHTYYLISIFRFLTDLIELMQTLGVDFLEVDYKKSMFDQLYELKTQADIERWFKHVIIYPLIQKIEERTASQYKNLSDNIIHIVQQEFDTDITLESIATRLHYNPNYLSSIFRKETNLSFSEYLSLYRINMAKKWLLETTMSVKEISEKLRYNNSQNFIRSFRKHEGTTPGKYRSFKKAE